MLHIWLAVVLLIVIFCIAIDKSFPKTIKLHETFASSTTSIEIWDKEKTQSFLASDPDGYVQMMSKYDLMARKAKSHADYLMKISSVASEAPLAEQALLSAAIHRVDSYLKKNPTLPISAGKLLNIPWIIAVTKGKTYENGFPHTRQNIILLNHSTILSPSLANTLLHEKIHVYQRMYPEDINSWMQSKGFTRWKLRSQEPLARANPDIDPWIYIDPTTSKPMIAAYSSDAPISISDVKLTSPAFEHPYEFLAYEIANMLPS
jgi:hypothetical protein